MGTRQRKELAYLRNQSAQLPIGNSNIDSLLSAEFPNPDTQPELLELVKKFMVHSPCGVHNPTAPCMDQETKKCSKNFPKPFQDHTTLAEDSYAVLCRHDTGRTFEVNGKDIDNRCIVPYSPYLIWNIAVISISSGLH